MYADVYPELTKPDDKTDSGIPEEYYDTLLSLLGKGNMGHAGGRGYDVYQAAAVDNR
jgi:hypothetical protein